MIIHCTPRFISDIEELQKKNSYSQVLIDVCNYFSDKSILELHLTRDIIQNSQGKYSLNKFRIMNSSMKKGKSGSYRCITVVLPEKDSIYLGRIYPKTGSEGIDNLTKEEYKEIAKQVNFVINNNLSRILDMQQCRII